MHSLTQHSHTYLSFHTLPHPTLLTHTGIHTQHIHPHPLPCEGSEEYSTVLTKFIEVIVIECDTKSRLAEAEMEEKRREQEQKHEERMLMMMDFMQRMVGCPPTSLQHHSLFACHPTPSHHACPDLPHSSPTLPFSPITPSLPQLQSSQPHITMTMACRVLLTYYCSYSHAYS